MSAQITWSIDQLKTISTEVSNFVCEVTYRAKAEQDGWVIEYLGNVNFEAPSETFTPYDQLTEEQVIGWVKDHLGPLQVVQLQASLQQQMDYHFNPPVVAQPTPFPWSKG